MVWPVEEAITHDDLEAAYGRYCETCGDYDAQCPKCPDCMEHDHDCLCEEEE